MFKEYNYGTHKKEIKNLLRKRLNLKDKLRYHRKKAQDFEAKLPEVEKELNDLLKKTGN